MTRSLAFATGLSVLVTSACAPAPQRTGPDALANPLAGAWSVAAIENADGSVIDRAQPGLFVFADRHYSAVYTTTPEPRPPAAIPFAPTDEEALSQFRSIIVNTGTYTVVGATITFRPLVARAPEFIGGEAAAEFTIEGDTLRLRYRRIVSAASASAPDVGESMTLRRVE